MTSKPAISITGRGAPELDLSADELREVVEEALVTLAPDARVLAVIPDKTRDDNVDTLFPIAARAIAHRGIGRFDALVAQGTHAAMTEREKRAKIGALDSLPTALGCIYDHRWDCDDELVAIGELSASEVRKLTGGLLDCAIPLRVNRLLSPGRYDTVLVFGATAPHEVAGFGGGAKYFFPGVAGPELTHATHWLGALATIENVIGRIETPTRHLIEAAADFIQAKIISFSTVVTREHGRLRTHALYAGDFREALRAAAAISRQVHVKYTGRKYRRVVALLDEHYEELWLGGKASYRLGAVIDDGGELLIYAPHLRSISETHGPLIERYGYAPLESVSEMVAESAELRANLCVAAHLAHVSYAGRRDEQGRVVPRYAITLASSIDEDTCRRVNLGFMEHRQFRRKDYESDPDTLIVERAGQDLYLVECTGK